MGAKVQVEFKCDRCDESCTVHAPIDAKRRLVCGCPAHVKLISSWRCSGGTPTLGLVGQP